MSLNRHLRSALRFARTLRGSIALGMSGFVIIVGIAMGKATAQSTAMPISQTAATQIQALVREKLSRTPIQRKINSAILYTLKARRGDALLNQVPPLNTFIRVAKDNKIQVIVKTNVQVTPELLQKIQAVGAEVLNAVPGYNRILVLAPLAQIETIASFSEVRSIQPFLKPQLAGSPIATDTEARTVDGSQESQAVSNLEQVRSRLGSTLPQMVRHLAAAPEAAITNAGKVASEGDIAHGAAKARSTYKVNGTGVKIGVLSDSYDNLKGAAADIKNGELPKEGVTLVGSGDLESGGTDEGRAMLQIIYDLAPGAKLYFATAFKGEADFANNIRALQKAGCNIIVDDVYYYEEPVFQDGIVAKAVNDVTAKGVLYFSSAGNSGNKNDKTSGVWEGNFVNAGASFNGKAHRFSDDSVANTLSPISANNTTSGLITLQWSDPWGESANDYDLFVLNPQGTLVAASTNTQDGNDEPFEMVGPQPAGYQVFVVQRNGQPRYLHLNTNRGRLEINTRGQTWGHSAAVNAFSVAAVDVATAKGTLFTGKAANPVETFSSDGLRRVFYKADGTPITPGNFLSTGGSVRLKPDIAAADGVKTSFPLYPDSSLNPFYGTSAAAPHAAGVAALLKSFQPTLTTTQIRTILTSTALDIEKAGVDQDSGYGIVMANRALENADAQARARKK